MSYLQIPVKTEIDAILELRIIGPNDTAPSPADGYLMEPDPVEISGVKGKFWIEYKII